MYKISIWSKHKVELEQQTLQQSKRFQTHT